MKNLIILFISIAFISCEKDIPADYVLFSGTIANSDAENILVWGHGFGKEKKIEIKNGVFSDTLKIKDAGYCNFYIDRQSSTMHIEKGDNINLVVDAKEFDESIVYTGKGSHKNNFLAKKHLITKAITGETKDFYSKEEDDFIATAKEVRLKIEEAINAANINDDFKKRQLEDAKYNYAYSLENYEGYHKRYAKKEDFEVSDNFNTNMLSDIDYTLEDSFKNSDTYKSLIRVKYKKEIEKIRNVTNDKEKATLAVIKTIDNGYIKDELLVNDYYYTLLRFHKSKYLDESYDYFMENTQNEDYKKAFTDQYNRLNYLTNLKGTQSPTFDYENFKGGRTTLTDFKGKYVFIDVWATWCGPCLAEVPALKELEKTFHGKNIEFVSISVDKSNAYDKWKKMIVQKELVGTQLWDSAQRESKFMTDYAVKTIPRFILIDPQGKIIDADSPRPSNPKLLEVLKELQI